MPNSPSAKKRLRSDRKRRGRNRMRVSEIKSSERELLSCIEAGDAETARKAYGKVSTALDKAAKVGTIHKNKAARRKSCLAKKLASLTASAADE